MAIVQPSALPICSSRATTAVAESIAARVDMLTQTSWRRARSRGVAPTKPAFSSALPVASMLLLASPSISAINAVGSDMRSVSFEVRDAAKVEEKPWRTSGEVRVTRHISPRYMPEIIFSKRWQPGFCEAASMAASYRFIMFPMSRLPHSVLITISSLGGPSHFPMLAVRSMYAAFVPVPKMTPMAVSLLQYAAASIVPTVSFASARTSRLMPRLCSCFCRRTTTSLPTTFDALNSLFHTMSRPRLMASCTVGNEKVKPITPCGLPPHLVARNVATESARKPKRSSPVPCLISSGT
mmetsp:Transcript_71407/g.141570  ORF Transcript_71407/g.141570 Transcript_71407/m.141570 type:complete len:296 (-) Transcript_71407:495-1382(-)